MKRWNKFLPRQPTTHQTAFTLIELLVVIAIIAILAVCCCPPCRRRNSRHSPSVASAIRSNLPPHGSCTPVITQISWCQTGWATRAHGLTARSVAWMCSPAQRTSTHSDRAFLYKYNPNDGGIPMPGRQRRTYIASCSGENAYCATGTSLLDGRTDGWR